MEGANGGRPPRSPASTGPLQDGAAQRRMRLPPAVTGGAESPSPFAAQAGMPLAPRSPASGVDLLPSESSVGALAPSAAALLRSASRGSTASAILRQVSLQSDVSRLLDDAVPPLADDEWEGAQRGDCPVPDR
jgi:hypothetical protein